MDDLYSQFTFEVQKRSPVHLKTVLSYQRLYNYIEVYRMVSTMLGGSLNSGLIMRCLFTTTLIRIYSNAIYISKRES